MEYYWFGFYIIRRILLKKIHHQVFTKPNKKTILPVKNNKQNFTLS